MDGILEYGTTAARITRRGADPAALECSFAYEETDIAPGMTLSDWRRARCEPRRRTLWARLLHRR